MKSILFDSGPVISLTTSNLLWILEELSKRAKLYITAGVKNELVDKPLETKRFKFEALQVQRLVEKGILTVISDNNIAEKAEEFEKLANSILFAHGENIKIVQRGEMETLSAALIYNAEAVAVDERVTRTLVENPRSLRVLMEKRLHMQLRLDEQKLRMFSELTGRLSIIRSAELVAIAYELGILDGFFVNIPLARKKLLEAVLWSVKLNGCSLTDEEIEKIVKIEMEK